MSDERPQPGSAGTLSDDPAWPPMPADWRHDEPDPPGSFPVPWGVYDAVAMVLWTILAQLVVALPMRALGYAPTDPLAIGLALVAIQFVTLGGVVAWLAARRALSWRVFGPLRPRLRHVLIGVGVGLGGFLIATILPELIRRSLDIPPPDRQEILEAVATTGTRAWLLILVAVLLAPLVEEIVYRGMLFQSLRHRLGLWPAVGLSSLTFAFVHLELLAQPLAIAALLVLGVWLAAAFHRTGSLLVPIVAHALFNGVAVALTLTLAA